MSRDEAPAPTSRRFGAADGSASTVTFIEIGRVLAGRYKVLELLGAGAMGMVFKVEDRNLEGRLFAIKVLPPELARNDSSILRLKREALAAIDLHHPNIMAVNAFEADGETSFLVMEYLDGPDLEKSLAAKGRLAVDEVLDVARQVCSAIAYAHERGLVHRDLKPANLLHKTEGGRTVVKVADFGIAYQIRDSMTRLTGTEAAGTLLYVAPEQLKGARPTPASDQYSLAATLYELLRGEPPFVGTALAHQVLNAPPTPISDVPSHVNAALLRALAKEPQERFPDCNALLAALLAAPAQAHAPAPLAAPPPAQPLAAPPPVVASPQPRRGCGRWVGCMLGLAVAAIGLLYLLAVAVDDFRWYTAIRQPFELTVDLARRSPIVRHELGPSLVKVPKRPNPTSRIGPNSLGTETARLSAELTGSSASGTIAATAASWNGTWSLLYASLRTSDGRVLQLLDEDGTTKSMAP